LTFSVNFRIFIVLNLKDMKRIFILFVAFLVMNAINAQGWQWPDDLLSGNQVTSVFFTSSDYGHAVGGTHNPDHSSQGIILKTTNGGETWQVLGTNFFLHTVYFLNENKGYAIGDYILRTINGGDDWVIVNSPDPEYALDITYFPENLRGYAITENDRVIDNPEDHGHPHGINEAAAGKITLKIYPNPSSQNLIIETSDSSPDFILQILDLHSDVLVEQTMTTSVFSLDISTMSPGIYFLKVVGKGEVHLEKFIKK
jgi:photosystem II stability/assembly factor-like uncharacterized protein